MNTCVSAQELKRLIHTGDRVAVIDARWSPERTAYQHYAEAHIPLAMFCDPTIDLVGIPDREHGRNPLPDIVRVRSAIRRWGLSKNHHVVVYDEEDGLFASRAWWVLKWAGLTNVQVLAGGLHAWENEDFGTAHGPGNLPHPSDTDVELGQMPTVDIAEVAQWTAQGGVLIDSRNVERFSGKQERLDLQAGHIPGSVNIPARDLQNRETGEFLPAEEIRKKLADVGVTSGEQAAVYSGSGLHSSLFIQAMHEAGLPGASLFVGGWSKWAGDPTLPIARS
ncbi:sulfurtransferase [Corynebacterium sp. H78]|uniref:sulfurtransferase n=1 Tax=Corynebacterium sp. H78 TaxID=3133417 RepID=UPI00309D0FAB